MNNGGDDGILTVLKSKKGGIQLQEFTNMTVERFFEISDQSISELLIE